MRWNIEFQVFQEARWHLPSSPSPLDAHPTIGPFCCDFGVPTRRNVALTAPGPPKAAALSALTNGGRKGPFQGESHEQKGSCSTSGFESFRFPNIAVHILRHRGAETSRFTCFETPIAASTNKTSCRRIPGCRRWGPLPPREGGAAKREASPTRHQRKGKRALPQAKQAPI